MAKSKIVGERNGFFSMSYPNGINSDPVFTIENFDFDGSNRLSDLMKAFADEINHFADNLEQKLSENPIRQLDFNTKE